MKFRGISGNRRKLRQNWRKLLLCKIDKKVLRNVEEHKNTLGNIKEHKKLGISITYIKEHYDRLSDFGAIDS